VGYFDAVAAAAFKRDIGGRPLFFPWGALGRGYELRDEAEHQRIRQFLIRMYQVVLPLLILVPIATSLWGSAALAVVFCAVYFVWVRGVTRGLQRSPERLTFGEAYANQARLMNRWLLWVLLASSALFVAAGVFIMLVEPKAWLVALPGVVFFGFCCFLFVRMLRKQRAAVPR